MSLFFLVAALLFTWTSPAAAAEENELRPITTADPGIPISDLRVMVRPLTKEELEVEAEAWFQLLRIKARQVAVARFGVRRTSGALAATDEAEAAEVVEEVREITRKMNESAEQTEDEVTGAARDRLGMNAIDPETEAAGESPPESEAEEAPADATDLRRVLLEDINELIDQRTALNYRFSVVLDALEQKAGETGDYRAYSAVVSRVELETSDFDSAWSGMVGWLVSAEGGKRWLRNLVKFMVVLLLAYLVANTMAAIAKWLLERKFRLSQLAEKLLARCIRWGLMIVGVAIALVSAGVDGTPLFASLGALGLVTGLALQDSLGNVASGLLILVNRPFDVGDVVTTGGVTGTVCEMNLVSTTFRTFDNQTIYVPNNEVWNNLITNITANETRRVDLEFSIGYSDSFEQAEGIIREVVEEHELVLDDPKPTVVTHDLAEFSVNIVCRPWTKTADWWQVKTDIVREVKRRFDKAGITIPYPQQDVHIHRHRASA